METVMIKKLIQHGNSSALIIDKPIMELLNINTDTHLELSTDGANIIISPVKNKNRLSRLNSSLKNINEKHSVTLGKLAK
jgi:antitoxin component of MazEF toxin-antitoxin module